MNLAATPLWPRPLEVHFRRRLLVLEEDLQARALVCRIADELGWETECAADFFTAEDRLYAGAFDCIMSDMAMQARSITAFLRFLSEWRVGLPLIMLGPDKSCNDAAAKLAFRLGLNVCYPLQTPLDPGLVRQRLSRIDERLSDGFEGCCHRNCYWRHPLHAPQ